MINGIILILKRIIPIFLNEMLLATLPIVYTSRCFRFARVCSNVRDFNNRNHFLTYTLLKQSYR